MRKVEIVFPFEPTPKGRPRFSKYGAYTPAKTRNYEKQLETYYAKTCSEYFEGPIRINVEFRMPIPKSTTKKLREKMLSGEVKHTKKPDTDNLLKAVTDALNGLAFKDDSQITRIVATKHYSQYPGTRLTITEDVE